MFTPWLLGGNYGTLKCVLYAVRIRIYDDCAGYKRKLAIRINGGSALTVFRLYQGSGEWFDLSKKPIERASFSFGGAIDTAEGYVVNQNCIRCKLCYGKCPQKCIAVSRNPVVILQAHCLHCGNCFEICPAGAVEKRFV